MDTVRELDVVRAIPPQAPTAIRAEGDEAGGMPTLEVRFSAFNQWYEIDSMWEGRFMERVAPGAFKRTIKNNGDQVKCLFDHGMDPTIGNKVLGSTESLTEEADSPVHVVRLFDTSYVRDLLPGLDAGVYGSSFRMRVLIDEWNDEPGVSDHNPNGIPERTIKEIRLFEDGPVTFPANPSSTAGLRSLTDNYYDRLAARNPEQVEELRSKVAAVRGVTPQIPADTSTEPGPVATSEPEPVDASDSAARHSETPTDDTATPAAPSTTRTSTEGTTIMSDTRMTVEERTARQSEIRARLSEIDAEFSGAALPDETRTEWDSLNEEFTGHDEAIRESNERAERIRSLSSETGTTERASFGSPAVHVRPSGADIYDLGAIRQAARSIDDLPRMYRDNAMRAVETARFGGNAVREDAQANVERLLDNVDDEQGTLARRILATGSPTYNRAFGKAAKNLSVHGLTAEEARALALGTDSAGGFAVPFQLDPTVILTSNGSESHLRQISRVEQIVGKEWQGITSTGITVTRSAEAAETSDNSPALDQPTVKAERVTGFVPFSIEVDQDWSSLQSEVTTLLADAKDQEEATSFITGTGASPEANGLVTTLDVSSNVVGNTLTVAALYALEEALPDRFRNNASFLGNRSVYNAVRQFDTAGGANLWERIGKGQPDELLGYAAYRASAMTDATLAVGDRYLVLGDFRQFLIVDRVGMSVELVPHLFGANRRPTGQRGLLAVWRNNSKVLADNAFRVLHKAV